MEKWIPSVDAGIRDLNQSVEGITSSVTSLETKPSAASELATPPPSGRCVAENHQGVALEGLTVQERTLVQEEDDQQKEGSYSSSDEELVISESAVTGTAGRRTIRLQGLIHNQQVLILVDPGSSSNILSKQMVAKLQLKTKETRVS
ncbi:hypothetical protein E2562_034159 [Oryza meyeriana var. granulata]|uniref:Uncharacterized protein n=1 Tax=Oryza meyeriana var. granulata TaxID=110450 RepID=A0A6G1DSL2_9ORYZ|nr:hypothetical protein E2562_034159 [Oryza meyeriana var. granulata]